MNKTILRLSVLILISILLLDSCKKGEDDPFLSLRTRTSRFSGSWKLVDVNLLVQEQYGSGILQTQYTFNNNNIYVTETYPDTVKTYNFKYDADFVIDKKGTYIRVINYDGGKYTIEGNWMWLGINKEQGLKNKEAVMLTITKEIGDNYIITNLGKYNVPNDVFVLKELSNKKMVILYDYTKVNDNNSVLFEKGTMTYEKQ